MEEKTLFSRTPCFYAILIFIFDNHGASFARAFNIRGIYHSKESKIKVLPLSLNSGQVRPQGSVFNFGEGMGSIRLEPTGLMLGATGD